MEKPQITFQESNDPNVPAADEAVRQVFSAIALVRDRLNEVWIEHPYSPEQRAKFDVANELLGEAHCVLRRSIVPVG